MKRRAGLRQTLSQTAFVMLCLAGLSFPFSVAAANITLATALALSIPGGDFMRGARRLWQQHRRLSLAFLAYFSLFPIGLLWSPDVRWGAHILMRQWFWLLLPPSLALLEHDIRRKRFMALLSLGLGLHLLFCLAQMFELVSLPGKAGSTASDPTGHIGHTSFGLVYGLWAAWLMAWGLARDGWQRAAAWLMALWSVGMVFLSEGRGGYIVTAVLLAVTVWKFIRRPTWQKIGVLALLAGSMALALSLSPGASHRIASSWQSMRAVEHGDFKNPEARWSLWYAAIEAWRLHPLVGVGTGGFRAAADQIAESHPNLSFGGASPAHPHNMYLQSLARWGPAGLLLFLALIGVWIHGGWRVDWRKPDAGSLVSLAGVALAVQGLTEPSLEQHFPAILAVLLLSAGLAAKAESEKRQSAGG